MMNHTEDWMGRWAGESMWVLILIGILFAVSLAVFFNKRTRK